MAADRTDPLYGQTLTKRLKLKVGDVFTIPIDDQREGFGQIISHPETNLFSLYMAVFSKAWDKATSPPAERAAESEILLVGGTADALLYHERWHRVGNAPVNRGRIPWPCFLVRLGEKLVLETFDGKVVREATHSDEIHYDYRWSLSPITFQKALQATHGVGNWEEAFDKMTVKYASERTCDEPHN